MRLPRICALGAILLLGSCATPLPTTSGNPEVIINSTNTKRIKELLIELYSGAGYAVVQDTQYTVTVSRALDPSQAVLYQIALGNAYSSPPQMIISFTISPVRGATKVFGHISISMRGVFGQDQGTNLNHGRAGRELQAMLGQLKTRIEKGNKPSNSSAPTSQPSTQASPSPSPQQSPSQPESSPSPSNQ